MSDDLPSSPDGPSGPGGKATPMVARRALMIGAVGASAVLSVRPALAATVGSVLNCPIPVPDPARAGSYIAADGTTVAVGTPGAFAPPGTFKGEDVRRALQGGAPLPGASGEANRAYLNYIRRLQRGQGGFTCFASLQMPRS